MAIVSEESPTFIEPYPKGFRFFTLHMTERPSSLRNWMNLLWGFDIYLGPVPFFKTTVLANVCAWIVIYLLGG